MDPAEFSAKLSGSTRPLVVDFWAPWCAPCRMTKPILEKLSREYQGKVDFLEINADESGDLLKQYGIMGIPTVLAFNGEEQAARIVGARGEADFRAMFESLATGKAVAVSMAPIVRMLRLGGGAILVIAGISMQNWLVVALGGLLAFLGFYDRCPVWQAITGLFKRKTAN